MNQIECMQFLQPWLERLHACFPKALHLYNSAYPPEVRAEHNDSVAAHNVHCHSVAEFEREFAIEPGFHFLKVRGLQIINIQDKVVGRYKKVDSEGRHRNADTLQQRAFDQQEPLPGLPPEALRITFGYQPDPAFSNCERVIIARPKGRSIDWASQIVEGEPYSWVDITPARLVS